MSRHLPLTSHDPIRACKKAFDENGYRPVRIRPRPSGPSGTDLFSFSPPGSSISRRHFTYRIEATDEDPNLSALDREEAQLVRHYLNCTENRPTTRKRCPTPTAGMPSSDA